MIQKKKLYVCLELGILSCHHHEGFKEKEERYFYKVWHKYIKHIKLVRTFGIYTHHHVY